LKFNVHLNNPAIFVMLWLALSAMVLHDIMLRHAATHGLRANNGAVSERVVTREFVLVDDNGRTRARIGMSDKTQAPSVQLFDVSGNQRAQLRLNKDDVPSLRLYDAKGSLKSVMGFTLGDMEPAYVTFDANGIGHIENTNRPNSFQVVHDEDTLSQRLSFGSSYLNVNRVDGFDLQRQQIDAAREQALLRAQLDRIQCEQVIIQTQAENVPAPINPTHRDPFHPGNNR